MAELMKTGGPRLALLFRQVGLISESDWEKSFQKASQKSKGLVDILWQDVSWQTFVDLAKLEIRLPSRRRRSPAALPTHLTQAVHINRNEILDLLQKHRPDVKALGEFLAGFRPDRRPRVEGLLKDLDGAVADPYQELLDREILTPDLLSEIVQAGTHPAAQRNREILALEILALNGFISAEVRKQIAARLGEPGFRMAEEIIHSGAASSSGIIEATERGMALPTVELSKAQPDERARDFCPSEFLRRDLFLPIETDGMVRLATSDPLNLSVADVIAILTGRMILLCYAPTAEIIAAINQMFPEAVSAPANQVAERKVTARPAAKATRGEAKADARHEAPQKVPPPLAVQPVAEIVDSMSTVELVSSMIESAVATKATDIHLEPQAEGLRVRFRIDGQLINVMNVPAEMALPVISRIKVLANMNVTERRRAQDGHFALDMEGHPFDFRISALPVYLGEKMVLRILEQATILKGLAELGLTPEQEKILTRLIERPYGMILVTGPTGSGKTTTLYTALSLINKSDVNITTIEDPVEYQLQGINQVQVDYAIGVDFASGLRAALRQDPDIIMVGEIRDNETARIAIRAALTGHLVLSTLHTNSAVGAISALFHMGIQPYLIASSLAGVVAQRLVKKICGECKRTIRPTVGLLRDLGLDKTVKNKMYRGKGCSACLNTGYSGRTGVFEILRVTEPLRLLIIEQVSEERIEGATVEQGFRRLRDNALEKVFEGITSPDEVLRTVFLGD